ISNASKGMACGCSRHEDSIRPKDGEGFSDPEIPDNCRQRKKLRDAALQSGGDQGSDELLSGLRTRLILRSPICDLPSPNPALARKWPFCLLSSMADVLHDPFSTKRWTFADLRQFDET